MTRDDVLALIPKAKQLWDDNPPPPPSAKAAALAQRLITLPRKANNR